MIRFLAIVLLVFGVAPAVFAQAVEPIAVPAPIVAAPATVRVALNTSEGTIVLALEKQRAPVTTAYFLRYVDQKRLDGTNFYRANRLDAAGKYGLIQGGVLSDPKRLLPPVAHEPTSTTGLTHSDGTISLARLAPGTATANFFIVVGDLPALDAAPAGTKGDPGFAAFGRVVEGMDVVHRIMAAPTSPTAGDGAMKGQMIAVPVKIKSVRRVN
nr:peptidylprolyl isomerase [Polymorphobacter sp.]